MTGVANAFYLEVNSASLTTSTTAYAAGDQLGTEIVCGLSAVGAGANALFLVDSVTLIDYAKVLGAVDLRLFNAATTPASDNAASAWSDADSNKLLASGIVNLGAPVVDANNGVVASGPLFIKGKLDASSNFYADLIARAAPGGSGFFGAAGDLHLKIGGFYFS